ncbi:MAG: cadherin-like beta sandwich domain-containing protein, partial [Candidatus Izemoplasmatales bacterium]
SSNYLYQIRLDNNITEVIINASVDPLDRSTITGTGTKSLTQTIHTFKVTVTAENGDINDYIIEITRKNNNYNISNIIVDGFESIIFDDSILTYDLGNVSYSTKSINLNVLLEDSSAQIIINGKVVSEVSNHILKSGLNTFLIKARSEFGEESQVYTYTIYQDNANTTAELNLLTATENGVDYLDGLFDKDILLYDLRVDRNVSQIKISATANPDLHAAVSGSIGTFPLSYGTTSFTVNVVAEDGVSSKTYRINITRANDNNNISSILIDGVEIPGFDSSIYSYEIAPYSFDKQSVLISAVLEDQYANLTGIGQVNLVDGELRIKVYATSEAGTKGNEYTIILNRTVAYSDTSLADLVVLGDGSVLAFEEGLFNKNRTGYTIILDDTSTLTSIDIQATLLDSRQTLSGHTDIQTLTIKNDEINQTFAITVTSENGAQKTYSITVLKGSNLSSDASINRVTLTDLAGNQYLVFNPLTQVQNEVILDYQTSVIALNVTANNQNAIVIGNGTFTINSGQTVTLKFQVIAQDGVTASLEYEVKVTRAEPSDDNLLSSLTVKHNGVDLLVDNNVFSPTKYTYTLKVDRSVSVIDVKAVAQHLGAKVSGDINQVVLNPGLQQLKIYVTAESGEQRTYFINIEVINSEVELISLSVDNFNLNYDKAINQYDLGDISSSIDTLNIKAVISSLSYGTISGDIGVVQVNYGLNIFTVTVKSEDQSQSLTYQIFANRLEKDNNNYLSELYVTDGTYILPFDNALFNKDTGFYQIILDKTSQVDSIQIFATAENGSDPSGTGQFLLTSIAGVIQNDFYVKVTAENGDIRTYQIQVIKSDSSYLSNDVEIKDISISTSNNNYEVNFDKTVSVQEPIVIDYKDSSFFVDIEAHLKATIIGRDLYKIEPGETKTVYFQVIAENGDQSIVYQMDVTRSLPDDNNIAERLYVIIDGEIIDLDVTKNEHYLEISNTIGTIGIETDITDTQTLTGTGTKTIVNDTQKFYVVVTAQDGTPNVYIIETNRKSDDSSLKSILINGVEMFGNFQGNYLTLDDVLFDVDNIEILASATSSKATISGNGTISLNVGTNLLEIYATSELGTKGTVYTVEITRKEASNDATLMDLIIKDNVKNEVLTYDPVFNPNTLKYTVSLTLSDNVSEILIDGVASSEYVRSIDGLGVYTLKTASSQTTEIFTINVVAESGLRLTYEIHVTRDVQPEDDITIDYLSLFGETTNYLGTSVDVIEAFSIAQKTYTVTVPYNLGSVNLSITNLNGASIIGSGNHVLNNTTTEISFYLVSKSGVITSDTYTITIVKEAPSTDNTLKELLINGVAVDGFSPDKYTYELVVSYEHVSSINVSAVANHPYANVIGDLGEVSLDAGTNIINVRVIAEDGSIATYKLIVSRLSSDNDIDSLYVVGYDMNYEYNPDRTRYEVSVPYTVGYVEIGAIVHPQATVFNTGIKYLNVGENIYEVYAISENGLKGKVYEVHVIREEVSTDSTLKSLEIRDAVTNEIIDFGPIFRPSTTEYIIVLEEGSLVDSLIIDGKANDEFASVGGNGYKVLKAKVDGDYHNIFEVTVRAQDDSTTTYTISVYKDVNLSNSTTMNTVSLEGSDGVNYLGTENAKFLFSPNTYNYEVVVPYHVNSITLFIGTETATAYGTGTKIFVDDEILFEAYIVSQSGINTTSDYVIRVTREKALENNELDSLTLNGDLIPDFAPDKTYYEISIPYQSVDYITIDGASHDPFSIVSGDLGTNRLFEGKNIYTINVKSQSGEVKTYTIAIDYLNVNAYLEDLKVINSETEVAYPFTFNPDTFEYTVKIDKLSTDVLITGRAQDQYN